MKEFASKYKFSTGLRPCGSLGSDTPGLLTCYNLVPRRGRLIGFVPSTVLPGITMDWPYPQLFVTTAGNFLCGRNFITTLDSSLLPFATVATTNAITRWSMADFYTYAIFTNGVSVYVLDYNTGIVIPYVGSALPVMQKLCNFKGQLIASGVAGYETNEVVVGAIGYATINPSDEPVEVGKIPMPWSGGITSLLRLGDKHIVVYGTAGITVLESVSPQPISKQYPTSFKVVDVLPESIQSLGVVAAGGDFTTHCFLDVNGGLWRVKLNFEVKELGFHEYFTPILDNDIAVSYDPRSLFRDFYISDGNSNFVLSEYGLCNVSQGVSSLQLYSGLPIATSAAVVDYSWKLLTDNVDLGLRSKKTLTWIETAIEGVGKVRVSDGNLYTPYYTMSPDGRAAARMTASDFNIEISGTTCTDVVIEESHIRWQLPDKSSIRGEYAPKNAS